MGPSCLRPASEPAREGLEGKAHAAAMRRGCVLCSHEQPRGLQRATAGARTMLIQRKHGPPEIEPSLAAADLARSSLAARGGSTSGADPRPRAALHRQTHTQHEARIAHSVYRYQCRVGWQALDLDERGSGPSMDSAWSGVEDEWSPRLPRRGLDSARHCFLACELLCCEVLRHTLC